MTTDPQPSHEREFKEDILAAALDEADGDEDVAIEYLAALIEAFGAAAATNHAAAAIKRAATSSLRAIK